MARHQIYFPVLLTHGFNIPIYFWNITPLNTHYHPTQNARFFFVIPAGMEIVSWYLFFDFHHLIFKSLPGQHVPNTISTSPSASGTVSVLVWQNKSSIIRCQGTPSSLYS